jgi:hypothetical protein
MKNLLSKSEKDYSPESLKKLMIVNLVFVGLIGL